jgi:hypothetical protein
MDAEFTAPFADQRHLGLLVPILSSGRAGRDLHVTTGE